MSSDDFEPRVWSIPEMTGREFEEAVATLLNRLGYDAEVTDRTADAGRDVIARSSDDTLVVECKCTKSAVGRPVVQKLDSAAHRFSSDARGVVGATGGFTQPAREYAGDAGRAVALWGYDELVDLGEEVEVYFNKTEGKLRVFRPPESPPEQTATNLRESFVQNLESAPGALESAVSLRVYNTEYVPAVRVEYSLDETFGTSTYPRLHRVRDDGRHLCVPGAELRSWERKLWNRVTFDEECDAELGNRPSSSLFGRDAGRCEEKVARRVAVENSTVVQYTGDNNVTYKKECNVSPGDVSTSTQKVLLPRQRVELESGEALNKFRVAVTHDRGVLLESQNLPLQHAREIHHGATALLCNDCGTIAPVAWSPKRCESCRRTLCADHYWKLPSTFAIDGEPLCARCYRSTDAPSGFPFEGTMTWVSMVFPPAPLMANGEVRSTIGFAVMLLGSWGLLTAGLFVRPSILEKPLGFGVILLAMIPWIVSSGVIFDWWRRYHADAVNREELDDYEAPWQPV